MTTEAHGVATPATIAPQLPTPRARLHGRPPGVGRGWPHSARAPRCGSVESGPSRPCVGTESVPPASAPPGCPRWEYRRHSPGYKSRRHRGTRGLVTSVALSRSHRGVGGRGTALGVPSEPAQHHPPRSGPSPVRPVGDRVGGSAKPDTRGRRKKGRAALPPRDAPVPWPTSSQRPVLVPWTASTGRILYSVGWDVGTPMDADRRRTSRGPDATRHTRRQRRQIRHTRRGTTADKRVHQIPAHASGRTLIGRHRTQPSGPVRFASDRTIPRRMDVPRCPWWCMEASRRPESKTVRPSGRQGGTA
jgi:hypothetical protein